MALQGHSVNSDEISYNKAKFEEITNNFSTAKTKAESIENGINTSIDNIKRVWYGSDDVITQRDKEFLEIKNQIHNIVKNLDITTGYLNQKNESLSAASKSWS